MAKNFQPLTWSIDSNIYEVNLRQYTPEGTFKAFVQELPRLKEMGIEILWFMPITPISKVKRLGSLGSYYACSDYTKTNEEFGSIEDFQHLVTAAHDLNMKVIIDWVANHTGYDHRWIKEHPEFYKRDKNGSMYDAHGWEDVLDLNYEVPELRTEMISEMKFWLEECDIDGYRCDMAMLVPLDFWQSARETLDAIKPLFWLAECEESHYHPVFDATYSWKLLHKMEAYSKGETDLRGLEDVLDEYQHRFPEGALHAMFTSNHDENSHSGSEYKRMGDYALPFAVLTCTWKGIPLIYSGQEMPNKKSLKFFEKDPIDWTGNYELADFYRLMLELRKSNSAMAAIGTSTKRLVTNADHRVYAFNRKSAKQEVVVVLNLSPESLLEFSIATGELTGSYSGLFKQGILEESGKMSLEPFAFEIFVEHQK
jgi:alpha-amylase